MVKKKRNSKPTRKRRKPVSPRIPEEFGDLLNLSSMDAVAKSLGVSVNKLTRWRASPSQKELHSGRPYNLGRVVLELMTAGHLTQNQLSDLAKKGLIAHFTSAAHKKANEKVLKTVAAEVVGRLIEESNKRSHAHGLTDEDWDELQQLLEENGYTDEWFDQHECDEKAEIEAYRSCITRFPKEKREAFEAYLGEEEHEAFTSPPSTAQRSVARSLGESHERVGIAIGFPKSASLFLDRVWSLDEEMPHDFRLRLGTPTEAIVRNLVETMVKETADAANAPNLLPLAMARVKEIDIAPHMEPLICTEYEKLTGRPLPAFLGSRAAFNKVYVPGDCEVLSVAILSIPVVDESRIDWEQVREIRLDEESRIKLRRFFNWLDEDMISKPASVVTDAICVRLDDYRAALAKHGVKSSLGATSVALSNPTVWGSAAASAAAGGIVMGTLVNAAAIGATVALGVLGASYLLERQKLSVRFAEKREKSAIAYVHEISTRFGGSKNA